MKRIFLTLIHEEEISKITFIKFLPLLISFCVLVLVANLTGLNIVAFNIDSGIEISLTYNSIELLLAYIILGIINIFVVVNYFFESVFAGFSLKKLEIIESFNLKRNLLKTFLFLLIGIVYKLIYFVVGIPIILIGSLIISVSVSLMLVFLNLITTGNIAVEIPLVFSISSFVFSIVLAIFYLGGLILTLIRYSAIGKFKEALHFNHTLYLVRKYFVQLITIFLVWITSIIFVLFFLLEKRIFLGNPRTIDIIILCLKIILSVVAPFILFVVFPHIFGVIFRSLVLKENQEEEL